MDTHFKIIKCNRKGCVNNKNKDCTLDKLLIERFVEHLQYFQDSDTCQVRKQVNVYRTENLIENNNE
jgi:hypothetical protein